MNTQHQSFKNFTWLYLSILILPFLLACSTESIDGVETEDVVFYGSVYADNAETVRAVASLSDFDHLSVDYSLPSGDDFVACVDSSCKEMRDSDIGFLIPGGPYYSATLPFIADKEYTLSLSRKSNSNAPNSKVILPDDFQILQPVANNEFYDGEFIPISWSPNGAEFTVTVENELDCLLADGTRSNHFGDTELIHDGADYYESSINDNLRSTLSFEESSIQSCIINIEVSHKRYGSVDSTYARGSITAEIIRKIKVKYKAP